MQAAGMPLATIRAQLRSMGAIDETTQPSRVAESAVEYIRGVLGNRPAPAVGRRGGSVLELLI